MCRKRNAAGTSERLRGILRDRRSAQFEVDHAHAEMWRLRHHIQAEKQATKSMYHLSNQKAGGWGQRHLTRGFPDMPFLATARGPELSATNIGQLASEYYSSLFAQRPAEFAAEDAAVDAQLAIDQIGSHADGCFSVDDIRRARHSLPRGKTCGDDNVVTEMLETCDFADWFRAVAFNQRLANPPATEDAGGIGADPIWGAFKIRLLSKCDAPQQFRFLRPIAILLASAMMWSNACFQKLSAFDTKRNEAHLGFCPGCSCAESVTTARVVLERRCEWSMTTCLA